MVHELTRHWLLLLLLSVDGGRGAGGGHRFAESEVTIHYRSPIRNLQTTSTSSVGGAGGVFHGHRQRVEEDEDEMRERQAEHMRRVYEQERRRKFLAELDDLESRRHMDNFTSVSSLGRFVVAVGLEDLGWALGAGRCRNRRSR